MHIDVLATGSTGNCYTLTDDNGSILILDAGIKFEKILGGISYRLNDVYGVCISHSHKDHAFSADKFKKLGIPIASESGSYTFGRYRINTFPLVHDVPCIGFHIWHPKMGTLVYLTDTEYCEYRFPKVNHILVECNYDKDIIDHNHPAKDHIIAGHMELQTVAGFVFANLSDDLKTVILCHMSRNNLDFLKAHETIKSIFSNTYLAKVGERIIL